MDNEPHGLSPELPLQVCTVIQNPAPDAVALQITRDHAGAISFKSMSFPTSNTWSVDLGGQPSYALIANGKVFVTVKLGLGSETGSQLIALDQATGHTVWTEAKFL